MFKTDSSFSFLANTDRTLTLTLWGTWWQAKIKLGCCQVCELCKKNTWSDHPYKCVVYKQNLEDAFDIRNKKFIEFGKLKKMSTWYFRLKIILRLSLGSCCPGACAPWDSFDLFFCQKHYKYRGMQRRLCRVFSCVKMRQIVSSESYCVLIQWSQAEHQCTHWTVAFTQRSADSLWTALQVWSVKLCSAACVPARLPGLMGLDGERQTKTEREREHLWHWHLHWQWMYLKSCRLLLSECSQTTGKHHSKEPFQFVKAAQKQLKLVCE